jgi:hypothetical protein
MDIMRVMGKAVGRGHAKHYIPFSQAAYQWKANPKGVCLALCVRWIKAAQKLSYISCKAPGKSGLKESEGRRDKVDKLMTDRKKSIKLMSTATSERWRAHRREPYVQGPDGGWSDNPDYNPKADPPLQVMPGRKDGGFGTLAAVQMRHNLFKSPYMKVARSGGAPAPEPFLNLALKYNDFLGAVAADADELGHFQCSLMNLEWSCRTGHAVAVANYGYGRGYLFFDPNGGVLTFANPGKFKDWFTEEFPAAKDDHYQEIEWIDVYRYQTS